MVQSRYRTKPRLGARIDWNHPLANGLVFLGLMNEGGGSRLNNLAGKQPNIITSPTWTTISKFGTTLSLDGTNTWAELNFGRSADAHRLTFEAWCQLDAAGNYPMMISMQLNAFLELRFFGGSRQPEFVFNMDSATWGTAVGLGELHHYVGTFESATAIRLYVDGVERASDTAVDSTSSTTDTYAELGRREAGGLNLQGKIPLVAIWDRILSPGEIISRYLDPYAFIQPASFRHARFVQTATSKPYYYGLSQGLHV